MRESQPAPQPFRRSLLGRILLHALFLVIALACLAAYEHFKITGRSGASLACLIAAALFGFAPVRDLIRILFRIEGKALHIIHAVGGLALIALPLSGVVSGTPILTHAALAPFAFMGAAQAVIHQNQPRNAKQAAALQRFAASLPQIAQFAGGNLSSPENARRAVAVISDILAKAQALGQTELESDPRFQTAVSQVSTRMGANLGLDAVNLALNKLAANPATAVAVPRLRKQLTAARQTIASAESRR